MRFAVLAAGVPVLPGSAFRSSSADFAPRSVIVHPLSQKQGPVQFMMLPFCTRFRCQKEWPVQGKWWKAMIRLDVMGCNVAKIIFSELVAGAPAHPKHCSVILDARSWRPESPYLSLS